jgi:cytochrome c553
VNRTLKKVLIGVGGLVGLALVGGAGFVGFHVSRYNSSIDKVYSVPIPKMERTTDAVALERGKHLAQAIAPCALNDCHGADLGGGKSIPIGPIGTFTGPNISAGGLGAAYSDGEMFRLIRHGLKKDGRTLRFMPAHEFNWLPDSDITAIVSYLATMPAVQKPNGPMEIGLLGKILDRFDAIPIDIARRMDHDKIELGPPPEPTVNYGKFLGKLCTGCHGSNLSGGPIPGAPPEMPVPLNLTPDASGLKDYSYEDFERALTKGIRKNGKKLDPMMANPVYNNWDETEKKALWSFLRSLPPRAFGGR